MKAMSKRTNEEIYLEWLNDWLTIESMADNYNIPIQELEEKINKGRDEHVKYLWDKRFIKL